MKKLALAGSALLMVAALSCTRELDIETPVSQKYVFEAVWADGSDTRTALQSDGTSVWWTTGEEINVFYGSIASGKFVSTNTEPAALASFSGSLPVVTGTVEAGHSAPAFWGVYPYDAANSCDGESLTLTVPARQPATDGTFADKFFPAVAVSQDFALAFYNVCGGARFSVANAGINAVSFEAVGGESLVGKVKVGFGSDGKPVVRQVSEGSAEVTVNAPAGGFVPGKYYFAAFLPGTLSQGIKITYRTTTQSASITNSNSLTVNRSRFGTIDRKDEGLTFVNGGGAGNSLPVPEAVDLGLSVKWASFDVGASRSGEKGYYYAWGETETKELYDEDHYKWMFRDNTWLEDWYHYLSPFFVRTKYGRNDDRYVLDPDDDVAYVSFGGKWRMPTKAEFEELVEYCSWEHATLNGTEGLRATGPSGKSIFLPFGGQMNYDSVVNEGGFFWSSEDNYNLQIWNPNNEQISYHYGLSINSDHIPYGSFIRPVFGDIAVPIKSVSFCTPSQEIRVGEMVLLELTIQPENATHRNLNWSSSDETVATITPTGFVKGISPGTAVISVSTVYGGKVASCEITVVSASSTMPIPEAVDLGLSVKWASFNLGAARPEEYGYYYAWGETEPKTGYIMKNYKWRNGEGDHMGYNQSYTKYCLNSSWGYNGFIDGKWKLDLEDDAANVNLGGYWRMPTGSEIQELIDNCTIEWSIRNGVQGSYVVGPNGNSLFIPAAEEWGECMLCPYSSGEYFIIRSSTLNRGEFLGTAQSLYYKKGWPKEYIDIDWGNRDRGYSIRAVKP